MGRALSLRSKDNFLVCAYVCWVKIDQFNIRIHYDEEPMKELIVSEHLKNNYEGYYTGGGL